VSAQTGILVGWLAPTGILLMICFFTLSFYPLAGEKWEEIKKQLSIQHREKEKKFLEEHGYKFVE
jgi:Na+/melibiose symporter-like transporter